MRTRARSALVLVLSTAAASCGSPSPVVATLPPVEAPPPPPPQRARWVFSRPEGGITARLDLGGGSTLYVGRSGRRELARGNEPLVDAQTLAIEDLVGVLRTEDGQFAFVAADGDVMLGKDPLGPLDPPRHGPLGPDVKPGTHLAWTTTGRKAIMGVSYDGRLYRSVDYGQTWHEPAYAGPTKPFGRPGSIELDAEGRGILVHFPQRIYLTHDDGATWARVPSPGIGAQRVRRDGAGHLYLEGRSSSQRARLDASGLHVTSEPPAPLFTPREMHGDKDKGRDKEKDPNQRRASRRILSGARTVELTEIYRHGKLREIEIASAPLGEKPGEPAHDAALVGAGRLSRHVAGWGDDLVYLREDDDVEANAPTTTVFRSVDHGLHWAQEATLKGAEPAERNSVDVAVGPGGWTFVTQLCPRDSPEGRNCAHRQVKPAGSEAFQDMVFDEELTALGFAFDKDHDRVYALGIHNGYKHVYESPLSQNKFTRTKILDVRSGVPAAITVDAQGTLRALVYDEPKHAWELHRRPAGGEELPVTYVPIDRGTVAFAGARGLIFAGHERGWETADGGDTWIRTAANGSDDLACTEAGCLSSGAERAGWDLPAVQGEEKIVASSEPPQKPSTPGAPTFTRVVQPLELVCRPAGTATPLPAWPGNELADSRSADVRWASLRREADGKLSILVGTKSAVKETVLLPAIPKAPAPAKGQKPGARLYSGDRVLNDGVVAARYRVPQGEGGRREPIDVDLTWWSAATGRTKHQVLKKLEPFYVSSYYFSGTPQIVDGGLLFQPAYGREVHFIHDDGKVETFSVPSNIGIRNAERLGKRWLLADSSGGTVQLAWSSEGAKEWSQRDWGLDNRWGSAIMALIDGKPTVSYSRGSLPTELYPLSAEVENDPPSPIVVDAGNRDGLCDAKAASLRVSSYIPSDERHVRVLVQVGKDAPIAGQLSPSYRITHSTQSGTICTSAYALTGNDPKTWAAQTGFVYPDAKGWTGWWFRRDNETKDESKRILAQALTCERAPGSR